MKHRIIFILIASTIISCNFKNNNELTAKATDLNKELIENFFDAFNSHDWSAYANYYASDADFLDPSYGKEQVKQTKQQLVDKYAGLQKMIPDIKDEVKGMYSSGQNIVVEFVSTGMPPGGAKLKLPICTVLTIKKGKIIRDATYYDNKN